MKKLELGQSTELKSGPNSARSAQPLTESYKFSVIVCNNDKSLCQYCHIKIERKEIMLMKRSQKAQNDDMDYPMFMGYHCDCFFLSFNLKNVSELQGYSFLSKYHRQYIARKVAKQIMNAGKNPSSLRKELPKDLRIGYTNTQVRVQDESGITHTNANNYCEDCNMTIGAKDLQLAGSLKQYPVFYHPRCFALSFGSVPIILMGLDKLNSLDKAQIGFMLNIIGFDKSRANASVRCHGNIGFKEGGQNNMSALMTAGKQGGPSNAFNWPQNEDTSTKATTPEPMDTAQPSSTILTKFSAAHPKVATTWHHQPYDPKAPKPRNYTPDKCNYSSDPSGNHTPNVTVTNNHKSPVSSKRNNVGIPIPTQMLGTNVPFPSRKRKTSAPFRPNIGSSTSRPHLNSENQRSSKRHHSESRSNRTSESSSESRSHSSESRLHSSESQNTQKIELKKSTIRSEITNILNKYNHDYITSKIVRTMLMETFGCDLTPHKKFIDNSIMELLDIIENDPINLKSIPGRIFVEDEVLPPPKDKSSSPADPSPLSPITPALDDADISPFCIMSSTADDIAVSNVDNTISNAQSKHAWGDKSNSPTEKNGDGTVEKGQQDKDISNRTPIDLRRCCLCCFRIQTLEELASLYRHIQSQHLTNKSCVLCNIAFSDCYALMLHVAEFHYEADSFTCKNCNKAFGYHSDLNKHVEMCMMDLFSDISDSDISDGDLSTAPPSSKKYKLDNSTAPGIPELVSTLNKTQSTLNKINEFIAETGGFHPDDSL